MEDINDLDNVKIYELGYHIVPTVGEESLGSEVEKLKKLILDNKGSIISEEFPQIKNLSFEISKVSENKYNKFNKAYFGWVKFEIDSSLIGTISEKVTANPNVLRFIIVKTVKENTIYTPKVVGTVKKEVKPEEDTTSEVVVAEKASPEEIDKSIDELLVEDDK